MPLATFVRLPSVEAEVAGPQAETRAEIRIITVVVEVVATLAVAEAVGQYLRPTPLVAAAAQAG